MQCPNGDGELITHTTQSENDLTISYSTCPTCNGHWMESFAANYIKLSDSEDAQEEKATPLNRACPICLKSLIQKTGENIPDHVRVFECPDSHGYFFPAGQLYAWKHAAKAKINYFSQWHIPMPRISTILLAGVSFIVLAGGFFAFTRINERQVTTSQASEALTSQKAYVSPETKSIIMSATTSVDAAVTLRIPAMNNFSEVMRTADARTHTLFIPDISPGPHTYFFQIDVAGVKTQSDTYDFTMPE